MIRISINVLEHLLVWELNVTGLEFDGQVHSRKKDSDFGFVEMLSRFPFC